jgi:hypothetical protein
MKESCLEKIEENQRKVGNTCRRDKSGDYSNHCGMLEPSENSDQGHCHMRNPQRMNIREGTLDAAKL